VRQHQFSGPDGGGEDRGRDHAVSRGGLHRPPGSMSMSPCTLK
jgi:hypothetical protein